MQPDDEAPQVDWEAYREKLVRQPGCSKKNCANRLICLINPHEGREPKYFLPRVQETKRGRLCYDFVEVL
jgi:hypothetical protein